MIQPVYIYRAVVDRVIDGDTLVATLDLGLRVAVSVTLRVRGVNTPELSTVEGRAVKALVVAEFLQRPKILVQTHKDEMTFARWVADVYFAENGQLLSEWLVAEHLGVSLQRGEPQP